MSMKKRQRSYRDWETKAVVDVVKSEVEVAKSELEIYKDELSKLEKELEELQFKRVRMPISKKKRIELKI